jgi:transcriptional regulator with XRE-family HTH domain
MSKVKIHETLKRLASDRKINIKDLSKSVGIPHSTLSTYFAGRKATYQAEHLIRLSEYFQVTTDFLLTGKNSEIKSLNGLKTDQLFSGWLRVKIERAIEDDDSGGGGK